MLRDSLSWTPRGRLDHVGIATTSLSESLVFLQDVLGLNVEAAEDVPEQQVRVDRAGVGRACVLGT